MPNLDGTPTEQEMADLAAAASAVPSITGNPAVDALLSARAAAVTAPPAAAVPAPVAGDVVGEALAQAGLPATAGITPTPSAPPLFDPAAGPRRSDGGAFTPPANFVEKTPQAPAAPVVVPGADKWGAPPAATGTPNAQGTGLQLQVPGAGAWGGFDNLTENVRQQQQAVAGVQDAEAKKAAFVAQEMEKQAQERAAREQEYQKALAEREAESDRIQQDINNSKIDPNRLWHNMGAAGQATSLIGIVLSGIGSGLTGQPNLALQVLDRAIERDINAQTAELGKKQNALAFSMQKYGNLRLAQQDLRINQAEVLKMRLEAGVNAMEVGVQKQKGALLVAQAGTALAQMKDQFAQQLGMMRYQMSFMQGSAGGQPQYGHGTEKNLPRPTKFGPEGVMEAQREAQKQTYYLPDGTPMQALDPERAKAAAKAMGSLKAAEDLLGRLGKGEYGPIETGRATDAARVELARVLGGGTPTAESQEMANNIIGGWKARLAPGVDPYSIAREVLHDRLNAATVEASGVSIPLIRRKG